MPSRYKYTGTYICFDPQAEPEMMAEIDHYSHNNHTYVGREEVELNPGNIICFPEGYPDEADVWNKSAFDKYFVIE